MWNQPKFNLHWPFRKGRIAKKTVKLFLEVSLSLFSLFLVCLILLLARLSLGPINLDVLTPKMEAALQIPDSPLKTSIAHTQLVWRSWKRPCEIELVNFCIKTPQKPDWLKIDHVGISLQLYKLLSGEIAPKYVRLYHPQIILERNPDGQYLFGFMDSSQPEKEFSFGEIAPLLSLATTGSTLDRLNTIHKISILDAKVTIKDVAAEQQWELPNASLVLKRYKKGFQATFTLTPLNKQGKLLAQIKHSLGEPHLDLSLHFQNIELQALLGKNRLSLSGKNAEDSLLDDFLNTFQHWNIPLDGKTSFRFVPTTLQLLKGEGDLDFGKGTLDLSLAHLRPLPLEAGNISFSASSHHIQLTNVSLLSQDMLLQLSGKLSSPHKPLFLTDGIGAEQTIVFQGKVEDFLIDHLAALWPQNLAIPAREWLTENLHKGVVTEATFLFKGTGTTEGLTVDTLQGTIEGEGASITYLEEMPPVEDIKASATFNKKGFDITVHSGHTKGLTVREGKVLIEDLDTDDEKLSLDVKGEGPLADLLDTLNHNPLNYADYAGLDPEKVKGTGGLTLHLDFPLLKDLTFKDVKLKFEGTFKDIAFERELLDTFTASLTQGTMTCSATEQHLNIQGSGTLNQIPSSFRYFQPFDSSSPMELQLHITTSPFVRDLKRLGFDCDTYGEGSLKADLSYTHYRNKTAKLAAHIDTTAAALRFAPLQWEKKRGEKSALSFDLLFTNNTLSKMEKLRASLPPYTLQGDILFGPTKTLKKLHLSQFKGPFTNTQVMLESPRKDIFNITFKGESLNVENFLAYMDENEETKSYDPTDIKLSAQVNQLRFGEEKIFQNVQATAELSLEGETTFWKEVNLHAQAGNETGGHGAFSEQKALSHVPGGLALTITPHPQNAQTLTVHANDAGQFLRNLGIYDDIRGGQLLINATRINRGPYEGVLQLENFDAQKVPLLTRFAAVLSPVGIVNLFSEGENLSLEHFKCHFVFDENVARIKNGVGKSISLGFTVAGMLDRANRKYDLQGNIIPARFLNSLLNNIPGLGTLLNGGQGEGLFGIAYKVTGSFDLPNVSLNPLSLLAPGFLRKLFDSDSSD